MKKMSIFKRFQVNEQGAVLPIIGFAFIALVMAVGFGFDYARASIVKQRLQWALDAAALAGAKMSATGANDGAVRQEAQRYFAANFPANFMDTGPMPTVNMTSAPAQFGGVSKGYQFTVNNVKVPNLITRIMGNKDTTVAALAEVNTLPVNPQDVVIAIDVSGSMRWRDGIGAGCDTGSIAGCEITPENFRGPPGSRLANAKTAIKGLIDSLNGSNIRFGLVPWDDKVNVGRGEFNAVSAGDDYMISGLDTTQIDMGNAFGPDPIVYTSYGRTLADCPHNKTTWCDRQRIRPIVYLTTDRARVKAAVDDLVYDGNTDSANGFVWALRQYENHHLGGWTHWQTPSKTRTIVLVTDGINTRFYAGPPYSDQRASTNAQTMAWCDYAKGLNGGMSEPIQNIYTIAFNMQGNLSSDMVEAKNMLSYCASSGCPTRPGGKCFFTADNQAQLVQALSVVSGSLMTMRLTR